MWTWILLATLSVAQEEPKPASPDSFMCCDTPGHTDVVRRAVAVHDSLADPSQDGVGGQLYGLRGAVIKLKKSASNEDERAVIDDLRAALDELKDRPEDAVRKDLGRIMRPVVYLALNHIGGKLEVAEAYCKGKSPWLQDPSEPLQSPYANGCAAWR